MARSYRVEYTVLGTGGFPTDMLRFDESYPADTASATKIAPGRHSGEEAWGVREINLVHHTTERTWMPSTRWGSFSWNVSREPRRTVVS